MTRRLLIDRYREALVRPGVVSSPSPSLSPIDLSSLPSSDTLASADPGTLFDVRWRLSVHAAAIEHVLTKTAVSEQSKRIYRALQGLSPDSGGLSPREIAVRFGVTYDVVKQVKSRVDRAVAAIERQMMK